MAVDASFVTLPTQLTTYVSDNADGSDASVFTSGSLNGYDSVEIATLLSGKISGVTSTTETLVHIYETGNGTYSFTAPAGVTEVLLVVKGDVSGDGRVNMGDVSKLYAHIKGTNMLTGVTLFTADISDDGRINMGDVSKLYAHIKGTNLLAWDI